MEHFAAAKVRHLNYLSVNSHEVLRRIEAFQERLIVENLHKYADRFGALCARLAIDPVCLEHYETDIQWSVLHFLLGIANSPVQFVIQNRNDIALNDDSTAAVVDVAGELERQELIQSLKELPAELMTNDENEDDEQSELSVNRDLAFLFQILLQ